MGLYFCRDDTLRTIKKKKYGSNAFALCLVLAVYKEKRLQTKRFGKKQVDAIQKGLKGYGAVLTEARKAELKPSDYSKRS